VIDLVNMWTPRRHQGAVELDANKEYEITAKGCPEAFSCRRVHRRDTTTFRSEVGQAIDYYFFYGPALNQVIADYRQLTGEAPMFPKWVYGYWQCRERYHTQKESLTLERSSASATFRLTPWSRTGSTGESMGGTP